MGREDVYAIVAGLIAELADVPIDVVTPTARLEDLDVDSITKVEMLVRLRTERGVDIPDDARLVSVGDVVDHVAVALAALAALAAGIR